MGLHMPLKEINESSEEVIDIIKQAFIITILQPALCVKYKSLVMKNLNQNSLASTLHYDSR